MLLGIKEHLVKDRLDVIEKQLSIHSVTPPEHEEEGGSS